MKFLTEVGVREVQGNYMMARECYFVAMKGSLRAKETFTVSLDIRDEQKQKKVKQVENVAKVRIDEQVQKDVTEFFYQNYDVLAYSPLKMKWVCPKVIVHRLNMRKDLRPIKQRIRSSSPKRQEVIKQEVNKLMSAKFISDIIYQEQLANAILVKKANGK